MGAASASACGPVWDIPQGLAGRGALAAMALLNGRQNQAAVALLDPAPGDVVLEIGSGPGLALRKLVRAVGPEGFVVGIDKSRTATRVAAHAIRGAVLDGRAFVKQCGPELMPFRDRMFDKALAVNSFGLWEDPVRALREIGRVLRPGGRLVITQRGHHLQTPSEFPGAAEGFDRIGQAVALLKASGWRLVDERADRDGARLLALSVLAERVE